MFLDLWLLLLLSSPWTVSMKRLNENCLTMTLDSDIPSNGQNFILETEKAYCMEFRRSNRIIINMSLNDGNNTVERRMLQPASCSCFFCNNTHRNYVNCRICSEADTGDDTSWDKATFVIVTVAVIVGAGVVLAVIFRNKMIRAWKRDTNNSCTDKIEVIPERLHHILANDTETISLASRLSSARAEDRENYRRPLQVPVRRNNPLTSTHRFRIQPSIHRVFEDDDECEMYTEIIDDDMECDPGPHAHHDVVSRHECDIALPFLKRECGQGVNAVDDYNRLDLQSNRNKPTDCVSADEEKCRLLRCPTRLPEGQLCGEYEVAKPVANAHVHSNKVEDKPATDNALPGNTSDAHTAHDITLSAPHNNTSLDHFFDEHSHLENKTPQHQTSDEHAFPDSTSHNNVLHDNTPPDRTPHDNHSPYYTLTKCSPEETVCDNVLGEKLLGKVDCLPSCLYTENVRQLTDADKGDKRHGPSEQAAQP